MTAFLNSNKIKALNYCGHHMAIASPCMFISFYQHTLATTSAHIQVYCYPTGLETIALWEIVHHCILLHYILPVLLPFQYSTRRLANLLPV